MNPLEAGFIGLTLGAGGVIFAGLAWQIATETLKRYTDQQVREAKQDLREYVRDREEREY
jgi:hypothetical protein